MHQLMSQLFINKLFWYLQSCIFKLFILHIYNIYISSSISFFLISLPFLNYKNLTNLGCFKSAFYLTEQISIYYVRWLIMLDE